MGQLILALVTIGVTIYAVIDCLRSKESEIKGMPKPLWIAVIVLLPLIGGILWILLSGRSEPGGHAIGGRRTVVAPDDDPDFLRTLKPPTAEHPADQGDDDTP